MGLGYIEGNIGYLHHSTSTLFKVPDIATGSVIAKCNVRHRHQAFRPFLLLIDTDMSANLDIRLVRDNYAMLKHAAVKRRLAERPRHHLHFTPMYSWRLSQVERWFEVLGETTLKRGRLRSVSEVVHQLRAFADGHNEGAKPLVWAAKIQSLHKNGAFLYTYFCHTTLPPADSNPLLSKILLIVCRLSRR